MNHFFLLLLLATPEQELLREFVGQFMHAFDQVGWLAIPAIILMFAVRIYRLRFIQSRLPEKFRWDSWPRVGRLLAVFATSFLGWLILSLASGSPMVAAMQAALATALGAIGFDKFTKGVGAVAATHMLKADPGYQPSAFRKAASLVVPFPSTQKLAQLGYYAPSDETKEAE